MNYKSITFSQHAFLRMFSLGISPDLVKIGVGQGQIIENYPDDKPHPGFPILFMDGEHIVYVIASPDDITNSCFLIPVYRPDPEIWSKDFRTPRST